MPITISCIPTEVTLTCGEPASEAKVRIRADTAAEIDVTALGYDPAVASLSPAGGKTTDKGILDMVVKCVDKGPCPADTTVTFDAGGQTCTLKITCTNHKASMTVDAGLTFGRLVEPLINEGRLLVLPVTAVRGGHGHG
jgi:hypothetical protein